MALVRCPDCGRQISDAAPACIGCGRPMHATTSAAAAAAAAAASASASAASAAPAPAPVRIGADVQRSGFTCPQCGGDLVTYRAVHQAGGAPAHLAPPDRASIHPEGGCGFVFGGAAIIAILTWVVSSFPLAIAAFVVGAFILARVSRARMKPELDARYVAALARYDARHLCTQCGATVARTESGSLEVEEADAEIDALLRAGQKIQAIRVMRDRTGLGLAEAKEAVDARERQL